MNVNLLFCCMSENALKNAELAVKKAFVDFRNLRTGEARLVFPLQGGANLFLHVDLQVSFDEEPLFNKLLEGLSLLGPVKKTTSSGSASGSLSFVRLNSDIDPKELFKIEPSDLLGISEFNPYWVNIEFRGKAENLVYCFHPDIKANSFHRWTSTLFKFSGKHGNFITFQNAE